MEATAHEGVFLYQRLLDGDPTASADLVMAYLDSLADWLAAQHRGLDPHLYATAAEDALLALIKNPASYKRERLNLLAYLRMSAAGDLRNLLRSERRHSLRSVPLEAVELSGEAGKLRQDGADPADIVERGEEARAKLKNRARIRDVVRPTLSPEDREVLQLMEQGERKTAAYAAILRIADRPVAEQRAIVKRAKDRLRQRLRRAGTDDV